jgi:hypothetical protein
MDIYMVVSEEINRWNVRDQEQHGFCLAVSQNANFVHQTVERVNCESRTEGPACDIAKEDFPSCAARKEII